MLAVHYGQMVIDDREWIAIDREILVERDSLLLRIQISRTKETWPFRNRIAIDSGGGTSHAVRNVPHENIEPVDAGPAGFCLRKPFHPTRKTGPGLTLHFKQ